MLHLSDNQLSGAIPEQLASLRNLWYLYLSRNALVGPVPLGLAGLTDLEWASIDRNMLWADDPVVRDHLDAVSPGWADTQTVPPTGLAVRPHPSGLELSWTPICYTGGGGYYEAGRATDPEGPFTVIARTADKSVGGAVLPDLTPEVLHFWAVRTYTPADGGQQNALYSPFSAALSYDAPMFCVSLPLVRR